jgi:hypothetical protein
MIKQKGADIGVNNIVMTIYGQPDSGKTTLGCSAKKPLLLDFDGLVYKAKNISDVDVVQIKSWNEIALIPEKDIAEYDTIIVDTCGRALDVLTEHLIKDNYKLAQSNGALTLQGYGSLKSTFAVWLKRLMSLGKDVVLLCHVKESTEKDNRFFRPAVVGGSLDEIMTISTFVGFLHYSGKNRVIDFAPCEEWYGKNAAELETLTLEHYANNNHILADIIELSKKSIQTHIDNNNETIKLIQDYKIQIKELTEASQFNDLMVNAKDLKRIVKSQIFVDMQKHADEINIKFNPKTKLFEE